MKIVYDEYCNGVCVSFFTLISETYTEKKCGVGFTWKKLGNIFHSENASKFTKICQVKT